MRDPRLKKNIVNFLTHAILITIALSCVFPVYWMFSSSLKTQEEIFTSTFRDVSLWIEHDRFIKTETRGFCFG